MKTNHETIDVNTAGTVAGPAAQGGPTKAARSHGPVRQVPRAAVLAAVALALPASAEPVGASLFATGATMPSAVVDARTSLWISDHTMGFCKLVNGAIDQNSCVLGGAVAPGQAVFRPNPTVNFPDAGVFYVPDLSSKSQGVFQYNYRGGQITNVSVLAPTANLGADRPLAVAFGPDNKVYVSFKRNGTLKRIRPATGVVETFGAAIGGGPPAMAFAGETLYLAEAGGLSHINSARNCATGCRAVASQGVGVPAPVYATSDGSSLYVASLSGAYRYLPAEQCSVRLASGFINISALGAAAEGASNILYTADDPTAGNQILRASVYKTTWDSAAPPACTGTGGGDGGGGAEPPAPLPSGATLLAAGATNPAALMQVGTELWVSDHTLGVCRIEAGAIDQNTCVVGGAVSPAQAIFVPAPQLDDPNAGAFYVPDIASSSRGVYEYVYRKGRIASISVVAPNAGLGGNRPQAVALGPNGWLYVSSKKTNTIVRIKPGVARAETVGNAAGRAGPPAMAFIGNALYLAEDTGMTRITGSSTCSGGCRASALQGVSVTTPVFVTADGPYLYLADSAAVYRYQPSQPALGTTTLSSGANGITAIGVGQIGTSNVLYLGEDATAGAADGTGRITWIARPTP